MNDFYKGVILSILRKALTGVSATLVTAGWLTEDQTTTIVVGLAGLVVSIAMSVWSQYGSQLVKLSALQLPKGSTLDDAKALAKTGSAPSVTTANANAPKPATHSDIIKATGMSAWICAVVGSSMLLTGCGGGMVNLRPAAIASETFSVALKGAQDQFVNWASGDPTFRPTEQRWQGYFRTAGQVGLAVDAAIRSGDRQTILTQAVVLADLFDRLQREEVVKLPEDKRAIVGTVIVSFRGFVAIWQAIQASNAPPPPVSPQARTVVGDVEQLYAIIRIAEARGALVEAN